MSINILVAIVNYNSYNDTSLVINDLISRHLGANFSLYFGVVDNSSNKFSQPHFLSQINSVCNLSLLSPKSAITHPMNFFFNSVNNGFGAACNEVIKFARLNKYYDIIWFLNSDIELDCRALSSFTSFFSNNISSIYGSAIYSLEDKSKIISLGTKNFDCFKGYSSYLDNNISHLDTPLLPVAGVSGASMFIPRIVFESLLFDEDFFMYVEENDYCYRASKLGFNSYICLASKVFHHGGKTFTSQPIRWYYKIRNLLYFKKKQHNFNFLLVFYLFLSTIYLYAFKKQYLLAYYYGVLDFFKNIKGKTNRSFND